MASLPAWPPVPDLEIRVQVESSIGWRGALALLAGGAALFAALVWWTS